MKYIVLALASAIRYDVSEGPTKVDFGEADDQVARRTLDDGGHWSNPLSWHDNGDDDEVVLTMLNGQLRDVPKLEYSDNVDKTTGAKDIYDKDGDGVEDNIWFHPDELDRFYKPAVFNPLEDMYNTRSGHLPGHRRKSQYEAEGEPTFGDDGLLFRSADFLANRRSAGDYDFKN